MVANKSGFTGYDDLIHDFVTNCYPKCLELEETKHDEYLECKAIVDGHKINICHWNKNHAHLQSHGTQYYFKHQHMHSYTTDHSKRGALIGTWTRVQDNCNDQSLMATAVMQKCDELRTLGYTAQYIQNTLRYMHKKHKSNDWLIDIK